MPPSICSFYPPILIIAKSWLRPLLLLVLGPLVGPLHAVTFELLHSFEKPGTTSQAALVLHSDGFFYGTAATGGAGNLGTVYKMSAAGVVTTLHSFVGSDGSSPTGALVVGADSGLYGVTPSGGTNGFGVAFTMTTAGVFTKLVDFTGTTGAARGSVPESLLLHADGKFYGVTMAGGASGFGTLFQMTSAGAVTTLLDFTGTTGSKPGAQPLGPLVTSGTMLYGVTKAGGTAGLGVIYECSTAGSYRLLGEFTGSAGAKPGQAPAGGLYRHSDGALYGTTEYGGTNGFGVAFKITTAVTPVYTALWHFADATGSQPVGSLSLGSDGQLYGLTFAGGTAALGTAYKITTTGTHTVLEDFTGETGVALGSAPRGGLAAGADGQFYAVTPSGGAGNLGEAFKVSAAGAYTALAAVSLPNGWSPNGAPVANGTGFIFPVAEGGAGGGGNLMSIAANGTVSLLATLGGTLGNAPDGALRAAGSTFYGVTAKGGASARGTMFQYSTASGASLLLAYSTSAGSLAEGPVVLGADGLYYGVGREGGASSRGTIYKITTAGVRTRVVSFTGSAGAAPGGKPRGPLALASNGNFYGLCSDGGAANTGLLYKLTAAGVYSVVSQCLVTGARSPAGGLVVGTDGALYGTMSAGGTADLGAMIRFVPGTSSWAVVGSFTGASGAVPGSSPSGELLVVSDGTIYGLAGAGGSSGAGCFFRYTSAGGLETMLSFTGSNGAAPGIAESSDGAGLPYTGGLALGSDGKLYGTAAGGGALGGGVVFRLTLSTPIEAWKLAQLGNANASDTGDPDSDGVTTLMEYTLQMQPGINDAHLLPTASEVIFGDGPHLSISLPRDPSRNDITIVVEVSSTLAANGWTPLATSTLGAAFSGAGFITGDANTTGLKTVIVSDTQSMTSTAHRFMRVSATR